MRVRDIMTAAPLTCGVTTNLAEVAHRMWQGDCGLIPVTGDDGQVLGVITDRDICIAAATRDRAPSYLRAASLVGREPICCRLADEAGVALKLMKQHRVRRLPVLDEEARLAGVISMNDIVLEQKPGSGVTAAEIVEALKGICAHHHPPALRAQVPLVSRVARRAPKEVKVR